MTSKTYRVRPGVDWVNGARVPESRKVTLTENEARFDLDHGRIEPVITKPRVNTGGENGNDGGN